AVAKSRGEPAPADCVLALAPLMLELLASADTFLEPAHFRSDPAHYARNLIYALPDKSLSLYSLVWLPGQWTPIHDHGSWGVVGVLEGVLEERAYVRMSPDRDADHDIELVRGGVVLLGTGAVSLHLYGRMMTSFNIYDPPARSRRRIELAHNES